MSIESDKRIREWKTIRNVNFASRLILQINPTLLTLPPYLKALQLRHSEATGGLGSDKHDRVPFYLQTPDGNFKYEVTVGYRKEQGPIPSRLLIAKYRRVERGENFFTDVPEATLRLIAEFDQTPEKRLYQHGWADLIVDGHSHTITHNADAERIYQYFGEFFT